VVRGTGREARAVDVHVDLYWLPLGAGGHSVRLNGRVYEAIVAAVERRGRRDHSALEVTVDGTRFVIETAPLPTDAASCGVVAEGAVGTRWAGRLSRVFRYGVRCWRDGSIPDVAEAVESPRRLTNDPGAARRMLELVPRVPRAVWGRDELRAGEMWNSNSLTSWLIASAGLAVESVDPPAGGRAPGWEAGIVVARRAEQPRAAIQLRHGLGSQTRRSDPLEGCSRL
jgi:hypothetical protein